MMPAADRPTTPIQDWEIPRLDAGRKFIDENFARSIDLPQIAKAAGLGVDQFHRRFKLHFGQTPKQVRTACQIACAKRLMLAGGLPMWRVAMDSGFSGQSHLNSRFLQITGKTPGDWLREQRPGSDKMKNLTPAQILWLKAIAEGRHPSDHLHGRSAHGGATRTRASLTRQGYVDQEGNITQAGREALGCAKADAA